MHFLISNDDGYQAIGIETLAREMSGFGEVTVVAPDRNRSGASNSLTLQAPLYVQQAANGYFYVNGTPTDCVHLAITGLLDNLPDMVVSGINHGANLGDDVIYSGTVAAAMEGRFLGKPAVALSLAGENPVHYDAAAKVVHVIIKKLLSDPVDDDMLLNINIPNVPFAEMAGIEVTRLGHRRKSEPAVKMQDPKERTVYWVGPVGEGADAGPGTDFYAISANKISITPLQVDLTHHAVLEKICDWVSDIDVDE